MIEKSERNSHISRAQLKELLSLCPFYLCRYSENYASVSNFYYNTFPHFADYFFLLGRLTPSSVSYSHIHNKECDIILLLCFYQISNWCTLCLVQNLATRPNMQTTIILYFKRREHSTRSDSTQQLNRPV